MGQVRVPMGREALGPSPVWWFMATCVLPALPGVSISPGDPSLPLLLAMRLGSTGRLRPPPLPLGLLPFKSH